MLQDLLNHLRNHNPHYRIVKIKVSLIVAWEYTVSGIITIFDEIYMEVQNPEELMKVLHKCTW